MIWCPETEYQGVHEGLGLTQPCPPALTADQLEGCRTTKSASQKPGLPGRRPEAREPGEGLGMPLSGRVLA